MLHNNKMYSTSKLAFKIKTALILVSDKQKRILKFLELFFRIFVTWKRSEQMMIVV